MSKEVSVETILETQQFAIFDVLVRNCGKVLTPDNIEKIMAEMIHEMRVGYCSWGILASHPQPRKTMSTPPTLRSLCESAPPGPGVICPISPQMMLKVLDALEGIVKNAPIVDCDNFHHSSKDRHEGFVCPPHQRWIAALQSAREALNLLNGSTPEKI